MQEQNITVNIYWLHVSISTCSLRLVHFVSEWCSTCSFRSVICVIVNIVAWLQSDLKFC